MEISIPEKIVFILKRGPGTQWSFHSMWCWIFPRKYKYMFAFFIFFWTLKYCQLLKFAPKEDKNICAACGQYQGCWWPGDAKSQGISNHDIDLVITEYSFSTRRSTLRPEQNGHHLADDILQVVLLRRAPLCDVILFIVQGCGISIANIPEML